MEPTLPSNTEMPPSMRGNAPADLHAYRRGARLAREQPAGLARRVRDKLPEVNERDLARALGWFSVALGVAEVVAPRQLGRAIGMNRNHALLRAMGLREIASGVGILTRQQRPGWLWSRVAGDAIDLALLGSAVGSDRRSRTRLAAATAAVAGVTALDLYCSRQLSKNGAGAPERAGAGEAGNEPVHETVSVNASPEECYRQWRSFELLPRFMRHVESVRVTGERTSHWTVKAPGGARVEFDAEITADEPNRLLSWRSLPGSEVHNAGTVRFEPGSAHRGTVVRVEMSYAPPGGKLAAIAAKITGEEPRQQVREDLRRFKQFIESGEIPTTEGQPAGRRSTVYHLFKKERRA